MIILNVFAAGLWLTFMSFIFLAIAGFQGRNHKPLKNRLIALSIFSLASLTVFSVIFPFYEDLTFSAMCIFYTIAGLFNMVLFAKKEMLVIAHLEQSKTLV